MLCKLNKEKMFDRIVYTIIIIIESNYVKFVHAKNQRLIGVGTIDDIQFGTIVAADGVQTF